MLLRPDSVSKSTELQEKLPLPTHGRGALISSPRPKRSILGSRAYSCLRWGWLAASLLLAACFWHGRTGWRTSSDSSAALASIAEHPTPARFVTRSIEDIEVGDRVLAWDEKSGQNSLQAVDRVYRRTSDHLRILTIRTGDGIEQTLQTTDEHPFWVPEFGWFGAGELPVGAHLLDARGIPAVLVGTTREEHPAGISVFNLRVENLHTYYAGEGVENSPILVHNANSIKRGPKPLGVGPHNLKVMEVTKTIEANGGKILAGGGKLPEKLIPTPGGFLNGRRPDIIAQMPGGKPFGVNIGKVMADGITPVPREVRAAVDLSTKGKLPTRFVPYN